MSRTLFVVVLSATALLCLSGCPSIGNESGTCAAGDTCTCDIIGNCEWTCPGGGCHFRCEGTGNCLFDCAGGNCDVTCENTGNCILSCPGNDCRSVCRGRGTCLVKGCTGCPKDAGPDVAVDLRSDRSADRARDTTVGREGTRADRAADGFTPDRARDAIFTVDTRTDKAADTFPADARPDGICVPITCAQQGKNCGAATDSCGAQLDCGATCTVGACGGGGTPGVCGCKTTTTAGPRYPTSGTNVATVGSAAWANPANIFSSNAGTGTPPTGTASASLSTFSTPSNFLFASGFGLSLPSNAMINGIEVEIRRRAATGSTVADNEVRLATTSVTANRASSTPWTSSWTYAKHGGPADLWGRIWTPSEVNSSSFGVILSTRLYGSAAAGDAFVDYIRISVYYSTTCCVPKTCAGKSLECRPHVDGCGSTISCGTCATVGGLCVLGKCTCSNGIKDGNESDVDCGGSCITNCAQGKACGSFADCNTGLSCVDGVCCNSSCLGLCRGCASSKTGVASGTCSNITDGTDPDLECTASAATTCGRTGNCKAGACELWPSGTICVTASCVGGTEMKADTCNGQGQCIDGGTATCAPYTCGATTCQSCTDGAKNGSETDIDCGGTNAACARCAVGKTCLAGTDCAAGSSCVDGVCCSSTCTALCSRCDLPASPGTCGPIVNDDPDDECAGQKVCNGGACVN